MTAKPLRSVPLAPVPAPAPANDERLLTPAEVAELLQVTTSALAMWRVRGNGPQFVMLGLRAPRYRRGDVDAFIASRLRLKNSEGEISESARQAGGQQPLPVARVRSRPWWRRLLPTKPLGETRAK